MAYSIIPLNLYEQYVKHIVVLQQLVTKNSIYSNIEEKMKVMNSMQNCGLYCFFPGINPLGGVNVMLWQKVNPKEESYPQILFTLEMKNFSFTIPIVSDTEHGSYQMPKFKSTKDMQYGVLDFTKEELEFKCIMNANQIELESYKLLEETLRKNKLLK